MGLYEVTATSSSLPVDPGRSHGCLPVEVCERIIDHLAMDLGPDDVYPRRDPLLTTLGACALVCRDWYYLTWYHLHRHI